MNPEIAQHISRGLGALISLSAAVMGIRATDELLDTIRRRMVAEGRGPTNDELDVIFNDINRRSDQIQGS